MCEGALFLHSYLDIKHDPTPVEAKLFLVYHTCTAWKQLSHCMVVGTGARQEHRVMLQLELEPNKAFLDLFRKNPSIWAAQNHTLNEPSS